MEPKNNVPEEVKLDPAQTIPRLPFCLSRKRRAILILTIIRQNI